MKKDEQISHRRSFWQIKTVCHLAAAYWIRSSSFVFLLGRAALRSQYIPYRGCLFIQEEPSCFCCWPPNECFKQKINKGGTVWSSFPPCSTFSVLTYHHNSLFFSSSIFSLCPFLSETAVLLEHKQAKTDIYGACRHIQTQIHIIIHHTTCMFKDNSSVLASSQTFG